jgi:hypothetical protein
MTAWLPIWSGSCADGILNSIIVSGGSGMSPNPQVIHDAITVTHRCFPHIVNLACKAVLSAITSLEYAAENAVDSNPDDQDVIATLRTLIRSVRSIFNPLSPISQTCNRSALHLFVDSAFPQFWKHLAWTTCNYFVTSIPDGHLHYL